APDCYSVYQTALNNGAETVMPPSNQFYGDRSAGLKGPDGNFWWIATRIEDLSHDELVKRHHEQKERGKDV
ncbi:MAG: VOC family protein, partial [Calditrichaeota bacterium]|nr:VOC family protein [Calditrichota bacterium]